MCFDPTESPDFEFGLYEQDKRRSAYQHREIEYFLVEELNNKIVVCYGYYIPRAEHKANMLWEWFTMKHTEKVLVKTIGIL